MKKLLISAVLLLAGAAQAQDAWLPIAWAKDMKWDVKRQSGHLVKGRTYVVIERVIDGGSGSTEYQLASVSLAECVRGYGAISAYSLGGKFLYQNDFMAEGSTISDARAAAYCGAAMDTDRPKPL